LQHNQGQSGKHLLAVSISHFGPERTLGPTYLFADCRTLAAQCRHRDYCCN
jgi:hypothetical protein